MCYPVSETLGLSRINTPKNGYKQDIGLFHDLKTTGADPRRSGLKHLSKTELQKSFDCSDCLKEFVQ